jgi:hypothetical protein
MRRVLRKMVDEIATNALLVSAHGRGIYRSSWRPAGPICLTCGREVQSEAIVEDWKYGVKVLFKCHGQEELRTYDFGTEHWDYERLRAARMSDRLFDPLQGHSETNTVGAQGALAGQQGVEGRRAVMPQPSSQKVAPFEDSPAFDTGSESVAIAVEPVKEAG